MRQPYDMNALDDIAPFATRKAKVASNPPTGTPAWAMLPYRPRRSLGALSVAIRTAPPH